MPDPVIDTATTVKDGGESTSTSAPTTALAALQGAEARLSEAPPSGAAPGTAPAGGVVQPGSAIAPVTAPPAATEPGAAGIAQLRTAYDQLKAKYAWAEQVGDPSEVQRALAEWKRFNADPVGWYRQLGTELGAHPEYGTALKPAEPEAPEPQPDMYTMVNGERHLVYSATAHAKWKEWNNAKLLGQVDSRLEPMQKWVNSARETTQRNEIIAGARNETTKVMAEMRAYPHFTAANEPKIAAKLAAIPAETKKSIGAVAALYLAYQQFLRDDVFPTISSDAEKKVRDDFARKAAATGGVKPGSGTAPGAATRPSNVKSLAEKMASGAYNAS